MPRRNLGLSPATATGTSWAVAIVVGPAWRIPEELLQLVESVRAKGRFPPPDNSKSNRAVQGGEFRHRQPTRLALAEAEADRTQAAFDLILQRDGVPPDAQHRRHRVKPAPLGLANQGLRLQRKRRVQKPAP